MLESTVHFVGTESEVAHHAAPLASLIDYQISAAEKVVDVAEPGDIAIFYSEHFDRFREACYQLKQRNVATLYMLDGILEWRNAWEDPGVACPLTMRPVLSHKVACIGMSQKRTLDTWGNEGKTELVGVPRFDSLPRPPRKLHSSNSRGSFRLLVATAKTPAFTESQAQKVESALSDLKQFFESRPENEGVKFDVIWRLTKGLESKLQVENSLADVTGVDLRSQLSSVDAMISTASTSMLEAMLFDIPVALLDYHNTPEYVKSTWRISCKSHIEPVISELMNPSERKMLFQRTELHDAAYSGTDSSERMVRLIRAMQETARHCIETERPLSFPHNMMSLTNSVSSNDVGYQSTAVFPDVSEFLIEDTKMIQSHLSHSRREITHLQKKLAVREAELEEAHKIFDRINNHPIVGRLVQLGRWWQSRDEKSENSQR